MKVLCLIDPELTDRRSGDLIKFQPVVGPSLDGKGKQYFGEAEIDDDVANKFFVGHPAFWTHVDQDRIGEENARPDPWTRDEPEQAEILEQSSDEQDGESAIATAGGNAPDGASADKPKVRSKRTKRAR